MYKNLNSDELKMINEGIDKNASPKSGRWSLLILAIILIGMIVIGYIGFLALNFFLN